MKGEQLLWTLSAHKHMVNITRKEVVFLRVPVVMHHHFCGQKAYHIISVMVIEQKQPGAYVLIEGVNGLTTHF